jgi:hypothetical protein
MDQIEPAFFKLIWRVFLSFLLFSMTAGTFLLPHVMAVLHGKYLFSVLLIGYLTTLFFVTAFVVIFHGVDRMVCNEFCVKNFECFGVLCEGSVVLILTKLE